MNYITKTIIVILIMFGIEITGMSFAMAATPKTKNFSAHVTNNKMNRNSGTRFSQSPKNVRPKSFSTNKPPHRNKVMTKTLQSTSFGISSAKPNSQDHKKPLGNSKTMSTKTSKTEKNLSSSSGKTNSMQREKKTSNTSSSSSSSNDLKYGLKEGLKYGMKKGLKYGEKK